MNQEIAITKIQFDVNEIIKKGEQQIFDIANQKHKDGNTYRNSKVTWIKKWPELTQHIDKSISTFQKTIYQKKCHANCNCRVCNTTC